MDLTDRLELLSAAELGRAVKARQVSPSQVIDYCTRRIEARNPSINAFVYTRFDAARAAARALEERLARGEDPGPFAGVPFALKDFLPSKRGWTNSHGGVRSLIRPDPFDSEFCRAMELAGVKPNIKFTTKDDYAIIAMVENGLGVSIVPELLLQGHTDNLRAMELFPGAKRTIALAVPDAAGMSPAVQAFVDYAKRWVAAAYT